ncbi:MAG: methionyl-tRNA formyltransferase [Candidatus Saganbacteria bacterium]|uniref:Methionyl-tRNA formyltransferase n=1 Tax=Candidatus Saganbacteria bacterium TaxID=2575572 RepID=A0A833L245_UNCSA|nr:MAG: methionyl-tRNA formyltransferase [Candidatus Saganbacteria bacterium]
MGTPEHAAYCLNALVEAQEQIICAVTQPNRPKGRNLQVKSSPVKELAEKYHIPVLTPEKVKDQSFIDKIKSFAPDLIIAAAYGKILPKEILNTPKFGSINVHASLLPKYRGAAPVQWAIIKGEAETGITIMQMAESLDTGDIILQDKVAIDPEDTTEALLDKIFKQGAQTLLAAIDQIKKGAAKKTPQNESLATYAPLITKESGEINWKKPAAEINNRIRAMVPWPGAHTFYHGKMLKIFKANPVSISKNFMPGEIIGIKENLTVCCEPGAINLMEVQLEGGRKMPAQEFVRGHRLSVRETLPS